MKRYTVTLHLLMLCAFGFGGDEAIIEKVITFSNEAKSSVVIYYSGVERLRFFAVDSADGVFTLDLPEAYSLFDFTTLAFDQIASVRQGPIDPDVSKGVSIRFMLKPGVTYDVFEQGSGELTLFFESPREGFSEPVTYSDDVSETPSRSFDKQTDDPSFQEIGGQQGANRIYRLLIQNAGTEGRLLLIVDDLSKHKTFFLDQPRRFVLDLHETLLSLDRNDVVLDSPLVQGIRIRQFQSHPVPITRLVLDLEADANVSALPIEGGMLVAYAANAVRLADLLNRPTAPLMAAEPVAEDSISESYAQSNARGDDEDGVLTEPPAVEPENQNPDLTDGIQNTETAVEDTAIAGSSASDQVPEQEEATLIATDIETAQTENGDESGEVRALEVEPEYKSADDDVSFAASDQATDASLPKPVLPEENFRGAAMSEPAETLEEIEPGQDSASELNPPVEVKTKPENTIVSGTFPELERTEPEPGVAETPELEPGGESENSPFVMASDVDLEMDDFLKGENDDSLYNSMKGMKSNRKIPDTVIVTNQTIAAGKKLAEARNMQDEPTTREENLSALFPDVQQAGTSETLSGSQKEYRGFVISFIDVKNADVVDLLRFIADQVGINLYVDSSVQNLTATYRFRNIPWDQALDIILSNANLDQEFRNGVLRVATTNKFRQEEEARAQLKAQRELNVPRETVTFSLNYASAEEVLPIISEYLSPRGNILMDERTNMLIIEEIPSRMTTIRALIRRLDRMIAQVTIEARLVETTKRFLKELGIQWGLSADYSPELGTDTGVDFPNRLGVGGPIIGGSSPGGLLGGYAVNFPVVGENPSGIGLTLGNFLDNFKLDISLQMLESEGFGQIISSPKITTQNNKTALIQNGQRIPIQTIQRGTITTRFIDAVLELQVTPHITSDETVIMDVVVDKSEPDFTRIVLGNPVINIRRAETKMLVKNGGTAVIGGIFTINDQSSANGIPRLRKIPILKRIFGNELASYENQELLIFVTPRIVKY